MGKIFTFRQKKMIFAKGSDRMKIIYLEEKCGNWERTIMNRQKEILNIKEATIKARELYLTVFEEYSEEQYATNLDKILDNLEIIAESLDFSELFEELDGYEDVAGLLVKDGTEWFIYTNNKDSAFRQRFTIAHEIGHYVMNHIAETAEHDVIWRDKVSMQGKDKKEMCANAFAAELLMPSVLVRRLVRKGYSIADMAYEFRVSITAITNRLNNLGC